MSSDESLYVLQDWRQIADLISAAIANLNDHDLDLRGGTEGWSIRETVHHLVEANLVAYTIVIVALGKSGCTYDWSWLNPNREWMVRLGYDKAPVGPALKVLRALTEHLSALLIDANLQREVKLLDGSGAEPQPTTVQKFLKQQTEHVNDHLRNVREAREQH
ncbi:MAG TPA: DinB family protein [Pyrinomonadaceae bacterium]|nr:DinB family protein [Pyrinomonadaceae bacterium]